MKKQSQIQAGRLTFKNTRMRRLLFKLKLKNMPLSDLQQYRSRIPHKLDLSCHTEGMFIIGITIINMNHVKADDFCSK